MTRLSPRLLRHAPECVTIMALVAIADGVLAALDAAHPWPEDGRAQSDEQRLARRLRGPLLRARRAARAYLDHVARLAGDGHEGRDEHGVF